MKTFNEWVNERKESEKIIENYIIGLKDKISSKTSELAKSVWSGIKRESSETKEAAKVLNKMIKNEDITEEEKKLLKNQSIDLLKILPLIAIQGIPIPIPITPLLIVLGKKYGFDILPNSHKK